MSAPRSSGRVDSKVDRAKFGALVYRNTENLGDEIQSLAAMRFLPRVDHFIDRDALGYFKTEDSQPVSVIANGWYAHHPESWPPSEAIRPLLVSMHLSSQRGNGAAGLSASDFLLREPAVEYLRRHGPIGARDLHTLALLEKHKVPAYFSGCMTLTLQRSSDEPRGEAVVLNDVPDDVVLWVRRATRRPIVSTTHADAHTPTGEPRFQKARALLHTYETAHCVITTRLHCALPSLALGTPVLLLDMGQDHSRFNGLGSLVRRCSVPDFLAGRSPMDLEQPHQNPEDHRALANNLADVVSAFVRETGPSQATDPSATPAPELRFQTLLHVHSDHVRRLNQLVDETARLQGEKEQLQRQLAAQNAEQERLRAGLVEKDRETERVRSELREILASATWQVALRLRGIAGRAPAPLRAPLQLLKSFLR